MSAPGRNFYMSEMIKDEGLFPKIDLKNIAAKLPVEVMYILENKYGIYFRQRIYLHTNFEN